MKKLIFLIIFSVLLISGCNRTQQFMDKNPSTFEILVENLDTPWAIDFLPNGNMIFTERPGRISILQGSTVNVIAKLPVTEISESGLAGIAVDPDLNNFIYVYYTYEKDNSIFNKVSRFTLKNNELTDETVLLDKIPSARFHDGGRIKFGPDGKLYITTGDATKPSASQDLNSLSGKILRMNKDGSIPKDNPFNNYVYSYGHRNPQGIAWDSDGVLFSSEHGPKRNDEINIIVAGTNYGWPLVQCDEVSKDFQNALRCFSEFTLAPASIEWNEDVLYVPGLRGTQLRKIILQNNKIILEEEFLTELGRIREVVEHDGYLYIATSNRDGRGFPRPGDDKIIRIKI